MDKIIFVDYQTKITALWLNTVSDTVWGALGQASTPQEARQFIGAVEEAPNDGKAYLRASLGWALAETSLAHNQLGGRSVSDAHPTSAITGLDSALAAKAPIASPVFTGNPTAPTPAVGDNDTSIATTAFVKTALDNQSSSGMFPSNDQPLMNGAAFSGVSATGSRSDHVHPTDTSRAPSSAATASGTSFAPSGTISSSTVQAAIAELDSETQTALGLKLPLTGGALSGPLTVQTARIGGSGDLATFGVGVEDAIEINGTTNVIAAMTPFLLKGDIKSQDFGGTGYVEFASGLIINWGRGISDGNGQAVSVYAKPFTTSVLIVLPSYNAPSHLPYVANAFLDGTNLNGSSALLTNTIDATPVAGGEVLIVAIGF